MIRDNEQAQNFRVQHEMNSDDGLLMQRIAAKDRAAFTQFYHGYAPRIGKFLIASLKSKDLVDEVVNEVMLTVWQKAESYDPNQGKLSSWVLGIAHNKCLKLLERNRRYQTDETIDELAVYDADMDADDAVLHSVLVDNNSPERIHIGKQTGMALTLALQQLSFEHRTVLELTFIEQCSYQEIATITCCPVNTVKTRVFHARKKLADLLAERGIYLGG